jgi:hypothetical protein
VLLADKEIAAEQVKSLRDHVRQALKPGSLLELYVSPLMGRVPTVVRDMRERNFRIDVACAADAERALGSFSLPAESANRRLIEYNIALLKAVETDPDFQRSQSQVISLKKGQQYKSIYIICGSRGSLEPTSYSIGFDITLQRGAYSLSRVEYVTVTVAPAPLWPTLIAMGSAAVGSLIQTFGPSVKAAAAAAEEATKPALLKADALVLGTTFIVPMLTALIVYNIYDLTVLKDRVKVSRSWRSAVFVGFLCGFLNEKILAALTALVG